MWHTSIRAGVGAPPSRCIGPRCPEEPEPPAETIGLPPGEVEGGSETVLIVEDEGPWSGARRTRLAKPHRLSRLSRARERTRRHFVCWSRRGNGIRSSESSPTW